MGRVKTVETYNFFATNTCLLAHLSSASLFCLLVIVCLSRLGINVNPLQVFLQVTILAFYYFKSSLCYAARTPPECIWRDYFSPLLNKLIVMKLYPFSKHTL